jgi:hypothetical protein
MRRKADGQTRKHVVARKLMPKRYPPAEEGNGGRPIFIRSPLFLCPDCYPSFVEMKNLLIKFYFLFSYPAAPLFFSPFLFPVLFSFLLSSFFFFLSFFLPSSFFFFSACRLDAGGGGGRGGEGAEPDGPSEQGAAARLHARSGAR